MSPKLRNSMSFDPNVVFSGAMTGLAFLWFIHRDNYRTSDNEVVVGRLSVHGAQEERIKMDKLQQLIIIVDAVQTLKLSDLIVNQKYSVDRLKAVHTKFGRRLIAYLDACHFGTLTDEDVSKLNNEKLLFTCAGVKPGSPTVVNFEHDRGYIEFCDSTFHTIRSTEVLPYERIEETYLCDMECAVYNFRKGDVVAVSPRPTTPPFHHPPTPFTTPSPEYPSPESSVWRFEPCGRRASFKHFVRGPVEGPTIDRFERSTLTYLGDEQLETRVTNS
uniref:Uncharacterized protein n=1 Tax=Timema poppense TaxID=170557 RepID=A0A7R9D0G8_TIMPO|nr:unnamed protein product [Timema poppensis]